LSLVSFHTVAEISVVDTHLSKHFCCCPDVVTAYKELQTEKIALEESLKALSLSRSRSNESEATSSASFQSEKEADLATEQQAADCSVCSEFSDSLVLVSSTCFCKILI